MPSLISSRQMAGQPIIAAKRCASVVLPDPAGPLTITKVGSCDELCHASSTLADACASRPRLCVVGPPAAGSRNDPLAVFSAAETWYSRAGRPGR